MPIYEYRCRECGATDLEVRSMQLGPSGPRPCRCGSLLKRVYHPPGVPRGMEAHFNASVGGVVRNEADFRDQLARKSAEMSERLGLEHRYVPVDPADAPGVDREQAAELARRKDLAQGKAEPRRYVRVEGSGKAS